MTTTRTTRAGTLLRIVSVKKRVNNPGLDFHGHTTTPHTATRLAAQAGKSLMTLIDVKQLLFLKLIDGLLPFHYEFSTDGPAKRHDRQVGG